MLKLYIQISRKLSKIPHFQILEGLDASITLLLHSWQVWSILRHSKKIVLIILCVYIYLLVFYFSPFLTLRCMSTVSSGVPTIIIHFIVPLHPFHGITLLTTQPASPRRRARRRAAWRVIIGSATTYLEIVVSSDERLVPIISFDPSILCSPWWSIPNRTIHIHWPLWKCCITFPRVPSNWNIVDKKSTHHNQRYVREKTTKKGRCFHLCVGSYCLINVVRFLNNNTIFLKFKVTYIIIVCHLKATKSSRLWFFKYCFLVYAIFYLC